MVSINHVIFAIAAMTIATIALIISLFCTDKPKRKRIRFHPSVCESNDKYVLDPTPFAQGTFGKVFKCRDRNTGKSYAVKVTVNDPVDVTEIRILNAVKGNKLFVQFRECYTQFHVEDSKLTTSRYLVTELLYTSLYNVICKNAIPNRLIVEITKQLADALLFLKTKQIIHADLKPENIMFRKPNCSEIAIIDFGTSVYNDDDKFLTIQTSPYRCPESIFELDWSYPADMWSLGCLICEMYTGRRLFDYKGDYHDELENFDARNEHLHQIEIVSGFYPLHMTRKSAVSVTHFCSKGKSNRLLKKGSISIENQRTIDRIFAGWPNMCKLIKKMLVIDPSKRITIEELVKETKVSF
jgi:serine/threonine protein kinase